MADLNALKTPESIVQALQSALVLTDLHIKIIQLYQISDAFSNHAPKLLPNIVTHLSSLLMDKNPLLREWIIHLIDLAVTHPTLDLNERVTIACQTVQPVADKLQDTAPNVVKRAISALGGFALVFFSKAIVDPSFATTWQSIFAIRKMLMPLVVAPTVNEGVKLTILKFLQVLVMIMSLDPMNKSQNQKLSKDKTNTDSNLLFPSVSSVPQNHPTLNAKELVALGNATAQTLFTFPTRLESTSSSVVTATISLLIELAKERPQFSVQTARTLIAIMNVTQRQQKSMDKIDYASVLRTIKIAMLGLIKSPHINQDMSSQLAHACETLGARAHEIQHKPSIHTVITPAPNTSVSGARLPNLDLAAVEVTTPLVDPVVAQQVPSLDFEQKHLNRLSVCVELARTIDIASLPLPIIIELIVQSLACIPKDEVLYALDRAEQVLCTSPQFCVETPLDHSAPSTPVGQPTIPYLNPNVKQENNEILIDQDSHLRTDENNCQATDPDQPEMVNKQTTRWTSDHSHKPDMDPIDAFRRLLDSDPTVSDDGYLLTNSLSSGQQLVRKPLRANRGRTRWIRTVARTLMIQQVDLADACRRTLCEWVLNNFTHRGDVALAWIIHEWRQDPTVAAKWQLYILDELLANPTLIDPKDITLVRFIVSVPLPPLQNPLVVMDRGVNKFNIDVTNDPVMSRIKSVLITSPSGTDTGTGEEPDAAPRPSPLFVPLIRAIKEFADHDPIRRAASLDILFEMASNTSKLIRSPAVLALKKYFPDHPILAPQVLHFATSRLNLLTEISIDQVLQATVGPVDKSEMDTDTQQNNTSDDVKPDLAIVQQPQVSTTVLESVVLAKAGLVLALCSRDAKLLADILIAYAKLAHVSAVQAVLRSQVTPLIRALVGQYHLDHPNELPPGLVDVLAQFPAGAESLTLRILVVLTECITVPKQLVEAVQRVHDLRKLGGRFLLPILSYLDKAYVLENLGELVDLVDGQSEKSIKVFREATNRICGGESPTITPSEFITELHSDRLGQSDRERIRKIIQTIQICITHTKVFHVDIIITNISGFLDTTTWPRLLFRTAMAMYTSHKETVVTPLKQILHKAAVNQVWTHATQVEGWIRLYILMLPHSLALALMLPPAVLYKLLQRTPHVREKLVAIIDAKNLHAQPRVVDAWPVLVNNVTPEEFDHRQQPKSSISVMMDVDPLNVMMQES